MQRYFTLPWRKITIIWIVTKGDSWTVPETFIWNDFLLKIQQTERMVAGHRTTPSVENPGLCAWAFYLKTSLIVYLSLFRLFIKKVLEQFIVHIFLLSEQYKVVLQIYESVWITECYRDFTLLWLIIKFYTTPSITLCYRPYKLKW